MSNDVKITISGDDAKLLGVWQRQQKEVLKNQKALIAMGEAGETAGKKTGAAWETAGAKGTSALQGVMGTLKSATAGFVGIAGVIKGIQALVDEVRREYEHLRGQQARAGQAQVELAPLQREVAENLGDDKTLSLKQAMQRAAEISERTGASPADVLKTLSTALSFKERSATAASVLPLVESSVAMSPENGQAAAANVKALQAIAKIAPNAKAKDIQGFLLGAKLASPVVNAENFGAYTAPGIAQLMSLGNTAKEAAAFQGALGQGIGDEEGRVTATSAITFARQLKEETARFGVKGGVFQQLDFLQTPQGQRVKAKLLGPLMQGARNAKKVGLEGEAKSFATLVGFVQGEGRYNEILKGTLADTPELEGAGKFVEQRNAALENEPLQKAFRVNRAFASASDRAQLGQFGAGQQGITREGLKGILEKSGAGEREMDALLEAFTIRTEGHGEGLVPRLLGIENKGPLQTPEKAASQVLKFQAGRLERGERFSLSGGSQLGEPTPDMLAAASALRAAADELESAAKKQAPDEKAKAGPGAANQRK